jgi:hypothetical protein
MLEQIDFIRSTSFVCTTNYSMKPPTEIKETQLTPTHCPDARSHHRDVWGDMLRIQDKKMCLDDQLIGSIG